MAGSWCGSAGPGKVMWPLHICTDPKTFFSLGNTVFLFFRNSEIKKNTMFYYSGIFTNLISLWTLNTLKFVCFLHIISSDWSEQVIQIRVRRPLYFHSPDWTFLLKSTNGIKTFVVFRPTAILCLSVLLRGVCFCFVIFSSPLAQSESEDALTSAAAAAAATDDRQVCAHRNETKQETLVVTRPHPPGSVRIRSDLKTWISPSISSLLSPT